MPDNPFSETVITLAEQFRSALETSDAAALYRLISAYRNIYVRLTADIEALALQIASGEVKNVSALYRLDRYKRLLAQTADELRGFQALTGGEMEAAARLGVELGEKHARTMLAAAASGETTADVVAVFQKLPTEAIAQLLGFLDPQGPLYARLAELSPVATERVSRALVEALAKGYNPRKTAALMEQVYGMALTDSLRMTRTVQLYSYRESSRASYVANQDILVGWQWHAHLDGLTCMSCIAQHGSIHPMSETLNDHHNGRCAMLPVTRAFGPHLADDEGKRWFEGLTEAEQRNMMGKGKYRAYIDGKFEFKRLTIEREDDVYGPMKTEASLKAILEAEG